MSSSQSLALTSICLFCWVVIVFTFANIQYASKVIRNQILTYFLSFLGNQQIYWKIPECITCFLWNFLEHRDIAKFNFLFSVVLTMVSLQRNWICTLPVSSKSDWISLRSKIHPSVPEVKMSLPSSGVQQPILKIAFKKISFIPLFRVWWS